MGHHKFFQHIYPQIKTNPFKDILGLRPSCCSKSKNKNITIAFQFTFNKQLQVQIPFE